MGKVILIVGILLAIIVIGVGYSLTILRYKSSDRKTTSNVLLLAGLIISSAISFEITLITCVVSFIVSLF